MKGITFFLFLFASLVIAITPGTLFAATVNGSGGILGGNGVNGAAVTGHGVNGSSTLGHGVNGSSTLGHGVRGTSTIGYGVYGKSEVGFAVYADGHAHVKGNLSSSGNAHVTGKLTSEGDANVKGNLTSDGNTHVKGNLTVDGSFEGDTSITGKLTSGGDAHVTGKLTSGGDAHVTGNLTSDGNAHVTGSLTVGGALEGDTHITGNLTVDGAIPEYTNLALTSTAIASSEKNQNKAAGKVLDGIYGRRGKVEWVSNEKEGAWIQLNWNAPVDINIVKLYGRPTLKHHIVNARLIIQHQGDAMGAETRIKLGMFPYGGVPKIIQLTEEEGKDIIAIQVFITKVTNDTKKIGLSEIECFYNPNLW